jgi:predicted naringenin-chalcone synthase
MPAFIHQISTLVPPTAYPQEYARDYLANCSSNTRDRRLVHAVYNRSGIVKRHSVVNDFVEKAEPALFKKSPEGALLSPSTGARNQVYAQASTEMAVQLARRVLVESRRFKKTDITHVIFVSCTGFTNPGPDYHIIRELGLNPGVQRYTLGFMGCYAAFPALRMAAQFCEANADATVLVVCLELCTLHMQLKDGTDNILANSLFADGAAAALVSARAPHPEQPAYRLGNFTSTLIPSGEGDMAWEIGDEGFNIVLSSYVPDIISSNIGEVLQESLLGNGMDLADVQEWAVHPGGRSILDKVEASLALPASALACSRSVLRDYGNMSSATVLFVLKELQRTATSTRAMTCAMAFGPGLTVESAFLERIGGSGSREDSTADVSRNTSADTLEAALA